MHIENDAAAAWRNLSTAFATPGPATIFNDFAKVVNMRLQPNRHPANDMNTMWDLFERLNAQNVTIPPTLRTLILLNTIPSTLQTVISVQLQTNGTDELKFDDIRNDINTIYEQMVHRNHPNAHKLSAIKQKGGDPQYNQQRSKKFQSADQPDHPQQGSLKDGEHAPPKHRKRGSGRGSSRGRGGARGGKPHEHHDHSHIGLLLVNRAEKGYESEFPLLPTARLMIALQPSRVTPQSTIVTFSKDSVTYHAVPVNQPVVTGKRMSAFPELQRTLDTFKDVDLPMTVQNFKNIDKAVNNKGKGKEVVKPLEQSLASTCRRKDNFT
jgi:hypothetical protein